MARTAKGPLSLVSKVTMIEIQQSVSLGFTLMTVLALVNGWDALLKYSFIVHDKDMKEDNKTPREPHIHLFLYFTYTIEISIIVNRLVSVGLAKLDTPGVFADDSIIKMQNFQRIKSWSAAMNYMTHRDEHKPWKHVYDNSDVYSNHDWQLDAEKAHLKILSTANKDREREIVNAIANGEILRYNQHEKISPYDYHLYNAAIQHAFRYRDICIDNSRNLTVVFIEGEPGMGKDEYAEEICRRKGYAFCRSNNGKHPFDNYADEPAIILSDLRDSHLDFTSILQLFDPYHNMRMGARYNDAVLTYCKLMIVTSYKPLREWYRGLEKYGESREQLFRRITYRVHIDKDRVTFYVRRKHSANLQLADGSTLKNECNVFEDVGYEPNVFRHADAPEKTLDDVRAFFGDTVCEFTK